MRTPIIDMVLVNEKFRINRFLPTAELPLQILNDESIYHISKTHDELSIVCNQDLDLGAEQSSKPYSCLKVIGPLDFSLVGIIAKLSDILMKRDIPIFVISTYDTDYLLIRDKNIDTAIKALNEEEYISVTITPN